LLLPPAIIAEASYFSMDELAYEPVRWQADEERLGLRMAAGYLKFEAWPADRGTGANLTVGTITVFNLDRSRGTVIAGKKPGQ
jgi:hypothetical protein